MQVIFTLTSWNLAKLLNKIVKRYEPILKWIKSWEGGSGLKRPIYLEPYNRRNFQSICLNFGMVLGFGWKNENFSVETIQATGRGLWAKIPSFFRALKRTWFSCYHPKIRQHCWIWQFWCESNHVRGGVWAKTSYLLNSRRNYHSIFSKLSMVLGFGREK